MRRRSDLGRLPGMRTSRFCLAAAFVLALHVFMLAGGVQRHETDPMTGSASTPAAMAQPAAAHPAVGDQHGGEHNMAAMCLAALAGLVLLRAALGAAWSPRQRSAAPVTAPVPRPPTPPPIALGISRT
jgi:hypothetical protein